MESHFYQTEQLELPRIGQALVFEYQAKGYQTQQFGNPDQLTVQLKKEDTLRAITGFNKALTVSLPCQRGNARTGWCTRLDRSASGWSSWSCFASPACYSSNWCSLAKQRCA